MNDGIFEQLFELFRSTGPVNWRLASEVIKSVAGPAEPIDPKLTEEYEELALAAQLHLDSVTSLSGSGARELHPIDARAWAEANEQSFRYLVEPLAEKTRAGETPSGTEDLGAMLQQMFPALLGMQMGSVVGFLSQMVLGQFDVGLPAMDHEERYIIVKNTEAFAAEQLLDPHQVRLWAVTHELAYGMVLGVESLRAHIRELLDRYFSDMEPDPDAITGKLALLQDPSELQSMLESGVGFGSLLSGKHQTENLGQIQATVAFIDGYGDHLVDRAISALVPDLARLTEAHSRRRAEQTQAAQQLQQLVGLDLERHRARDAATFCAEIARRWGDDALERVWETPEHLPSLAELTDPVGWAARVLLDAEGLEDMFEEPDE